MSPDGIYPDDTWYMTEAEEARCFAEINRTRELLEYADVCLMGKQEQDGDPPDGIVVRLKVLVLAFSHWDGNTPVGHYKTARLIEGGRGELLSDVIAKERS